MHVVLEYVYSYSSRCSLPAGSTVAHLFLPPAFFGSGLVEVYYLPCIFGATLAQPTGPQVFLQGTGGRSKRNLRDPN